MLRKWPCIVPCVIIMASNLLSQFYLSVGAQVWFLKKLWVAERHRHIEYWTFLVSPSNQAELSGGNHPAVYHGLSSWPFIWIITRHCRRTGWVIHWKNETVGWNSVMTQTMSTRIQEITCNSMFSHIKWSPDFILSQFVLSPCHRLGRKRRSEKHNQITWFAQVIYLCRHICTNSREV